MKKIKMTLKKYLGVMALACATTSTLVAQSYNFIGSEIYITRSPFVTQQSIDSDIRLRSMGRLNLPIQDESNDIGLFKYAGSPAGLPLDYTNGKFEFTYFHEGGERSDNSTFDTPFQGKVVDIKERGIGGMTAFHKEFETAGEGAFVFSYSYDDVTGEYTQDYENFIGALSIEDEPSNEIFFTGYGHRLNNFIFGLGYANQTLTAIAQLFRFSIGNIGILLETKISSLEPSVGYIFTPAEGHELTAFVGPVITSQEQTLNVTSSSKTITDTDGVLFAGGLQYAHQEIFKAAISIETGKLDGDGSIRPVATRVTDVGKAEIKKTDFKLRGLLTPETIPFSFGAEFRTIVVETDQMNSVNTLTTDEDNTDSIFGLGTAWHFPEEKGLIGVEYQIIKDEDKNNLDPTENEDNDGFQLSLGGEYNVLRPLWFRAGVRLKRIGEDPAGSPPELDVKTTEINFGLEYHKSENTSFVLNYANTTVTSDSNQDPTSSTLDADEEELKDNSIQLLARYHFGRE